MSIRMVVTIATVKSVSIFVSVTNSVMMSRALTLTSVQMKFIIAILAPNAPTPLVVFIANVL